MAAAVASRADTKRKYSWWWDSHISPKNSKWLQENLTDMDAKVKQMIKLIEEDADSFARRAEMYYKKRPELMKMVEEFYRAYRALAERYDHATGVIRQAHRTMSEAFPNQVPFMMGDDMPTGSVDGEPRTPDMPSTRAPFDPEELPKDALGVSPSPHAIRRNGGFTEEPDTVSGRKGLKQLNDLFGSTEGRARKGHFAEEEDQNLQDIGKKEIKSRIPSDSGRMNKAEMEILTLKNALAKLEAEKEAGLHQYQQSLERLSNLESEVSRAKEDSQGLNERASRAEAEVQTLKDALTKLEAERESNFFQYQQCLEKIAKLEYNIFHAEKDAGELTERASKAEAEAQSLRQELAKVETEKGDALLQYKQCLEKISALENKLLHAEDDAMMFKERADIAEREVEELKQALTKLTEEREAAAIQIQQCLDTISVLEHKLASAQEEAQRLNSEVVKLKGAEEKCLLLEKSNQTMHSELESVAQKMAAQSEELTEKQKELGRLWTCLQEERLRFMEAETAFQTLQNLHSQSQEELRSMAAEIKNRTQMLQDLEARNQVLQNEVEDVKVENKGLNEVNVSSALTIQGLQDEISSLRETIRKLESEVELRLDQRNALQQEIYCLKEELNDLNKKQQAIKEQVESAGFSPESFGSSLKNLQDENIKLKEVFEKERSENVALLEKLEIMEKLVEKNALLEISLSDLNVELEGVREKVQALEESCHSLLGEKSTLVSENAALLSQLQVSAANLEKLEAKNNLLESSLLDANAEIEGLRIESLRLQDSYALLGNEKADVETEKGNLFSELDNTHKRLEEMEKERQSSLHEIEKLRSQLDAQKQEYSSLLQLSKSQLAGMETKIRLLQEEGHCVRKEYEEDQLNKEFSAQTEIFILQRCVQDLEENNFSVLLEFQKLLEASQLSEKLISELEQENLEQQIEVKSLYDQIKVLRMGLYRVLKTLEVDPNQWYQGKGEQDQKLLNLTLVKLQAIQKMVSEIQDEKQQLLMENSVFVTLLGQLQREVENLVTAKYSLDKELACRSEQYLVLQSENRKLSEMNGMLSFKIMEGDQKEEGLKVELKNLQGELSEMQDEEQQLLMENSVFVTLLGQLQQEVENLVTAKYSLDQELACRSEQYLVLQTENRKLSEMNGVLSLKIMEGDQKEEGLKVELKNLQGELSEIQDEEQQLLMENSVFVTLLGQLQREVENHVTAKCSLDQELACRSEQYLVLQTENRKLSEMNGVLSLKIMEGDQKEEGLKVELKNLQGDLLDLQSDRRKLSEMNNVLSLKIEEGDRKEEVLKVELKNVQGELLDLQGSFKTLQEESRKMLDEEKALQKFISELGEEKSNLEEENCAVFAEKTSLEIFSLVLRDIISGKFLEIEELSNSRDKLCSVNDNLNAKLKVMEEKLMEFSVLQAEKSELHESVGHLKSKCDEVERKRADQEEQIVKLSSDYDEQSKVLESIREANLRMESELQLLKEELVKAKSREGILNNEMLKGRDEIEHWESQAAALYGDLQIYVVHQALYQGKIHELIEACKNLEGRTCLKDQEIEHLKERISHLESDNEDLRSRMTSYFPAFNSLCDSVTSLENHTLSHEALHEVDGETKDDRSDKFGKEQGVTGAGGSLDFRTLQTRIRAIEEAVTEKDRALVQEISTVNSKLVAAIGELEELKSSQGTHQESGPLDKQGSQSLEQGHENSKSTTDVMTKDIMLDQMSESSSHGISRRETLEPNNQMLEIWETTEQDSNTGLTEKNRRAHPSRESMPDVSVDKLEISRRLSRSIQEVSERKILERLDSDAQKLTNLQITVQDLKKKVEITERNKKANTAEYDNVKEQLEESEESITKLSDANSRLMKSIQGEPFSTDEKPESVRKISEQAKRWSEKIGRLQVEVQKLQFLLLKLDDDNKSRGKTKIVERKTRYLLQDYLYGATRSGQKQKRRHFCACVQPATKGD